MNLTADTNVLVRALVADDPAQAAIAIATLRQAEAIAVPLPVLCKLVWMLRPAYGFSVAEISGDIRSLLDAESVRVDSRPSRPAWPCWRPVVILRMA